MKRQAMVAACAVIALIGVPQMVAAQADAQSTSRPAAAQRKDALAALQDARSTLARLTEASLSQDARAALARVSTDFRALYKAYTGEEPMPRKSALMASKQPDPDWEKTYDVLSAAIDNVIGPAAASSAPVGTTGANPSAADAGSAAGAKYELTTPVRQDFETLRQQLQRFQIAAGGRSTTAGAVK